MSIIILVGGMSILALIGMIFEKIYEYIHLQLSKREQTKRRPGRREKLVIRIVYKLQDIIDNITLR